MKPTATDRLISHAQDSTYDNVRADAEAAREEVAVLRELAEAQEEAWVHRDDVFSHATMVRVARFRTSINAYRAWKERKP